MPFYALTCLDRPGALQTRLDNRDRHLAYARESGVVVFGGPLLEDGQMVGSLVVIEADDLDGAKAWAAADPYEAAGLFQEVTIREWKRVLG